MAPDPRMDKRFEVGFTSDEEIFANSSKHFLTGRSELSLGDLKSEFFALAYTNEAESCSCPNGCDDFRGNSFGHYNIIH